MIVIIILGVLFTLSILFNIFMQGLKQKYSLDPETWRACDDLQGCSIMLSSILGLILLMLIMFGGECETKSSKQDAGATVLAGISKEIFKMMEVYEPEIVEIIENETCCVMLSTDMEPKPLEDVLYEKDLWWLSHVIYAEAGSRSDAAMIGVGSVVLNRVKSDLYPNTIEDVITQYMQYTVYGSGAIYKEPSERAVEIAKMLLEEGSKMPENVLGQTSVPVLDGTYKKIDGIYFSYKGKKPR